MKLQKRLKGEAVSVSQDGGATWQTTGADGRALTALVERLEPRSFEGPVDARLPAAVLRFDLDDLPRLNAGKAQVRYRFRVDDEAVATRAVNPAGVTARQGALWVEVF